MVAVIAGTGFTRTDEQEIKIQSENLISTPYGDAWVYQALLNNQEFVFLPRHGKDHTIAPHKINYRANIWALHSLGITNIIAIAAVGGISEHTPPEVLVIPEQLIDYTYGREHTFFDKGVVEHVDFSCPYNLKLRDGLVAAAKKDNVSVLTSAVYGVTQGPRLETAAEIKRMAQDGCDVVGMTAMPEAALARELGIAYATLAVVANWAAGLGGEAISMPKMLENLETGMSKAKGIVLNFCSA